MARSGNPHSSALRWVGCALLLAGAGCGSSVNEYLMMAQRGDNEEVREAIVGIGEALYGRQMSGYPFSEGEAQALEFLKDVGRAHRDPISRMVAISSIAQLDAPDASDVFLEALKDSHFGVRWEAAKAFTRHPDPIAGPQLTALVETEPQAEVRMDVVKALVAQGDRVALEALLTVFLDPLGRYQDNRLKAYDGITKISGLTYAFEDKKAWKEYLSKEFPRTEPSREFPDFGAQDTLAPSGAPTTDEGNRP